MSKWDRWDIHSRLCIMTDNLVMTGRRSIESRKEHYVVVKDGAPVRKKANIAFSELGKFDIEPETLRLRHNRTVQDLSPQERDIYVRRASSRVKFTIRHNIEEL